MDQERSVGALREYFEGAELVSPEARQGGVEVETLFVDEQGRPLDVERAEQIFEAMVERGWSPAGDGALLQVGVCRDGFRIIPEVGAGNLELISPPAPVAQFDDQLQRVEEGLVELRQAAASRGAHPVEASYDGYSEIDNVVLGEERDRRWAEVDGIEALKYLGHISSVHVTLGLSSIDEAFRFIGAMNRLAEERGWPVRPVEAIWRRYLEESRFDYDPRRFGPAPEGFEAYLAQIEQFRVVMDTGDEGELVEMTPGAPRLREVASTCNLPMFLGTVWFHTRLKVIDGQLGLEVRFIPRREDAALAGDVREVLERLEL